MVDFYSIDIDNTGKLCGDFSFLRRKINHSNKTVAPNDLSCAKSFVKMSELKNYAQKCDTAV